MKPNLDHLTAEAKRAANDYRIAKLTKTGAEKTHKTYVSIVAEQLRNEPPAIVSKQFVQGVDE